MKAGGNPKTIRVKREREHIHMQNGAQWLASLTHSSRVAGSVLSLGYCLCSVACPILFLEI